MSSLFRRFVAPEALIRVRRNRWNELVDELARRGRGARESGAFLLTPKAGDRRTVSEIIYFDDLDSEALNGGVHLRSFAFSRLWRICRERKLAVACDVHTHPGRWVSQSGIDKENPMIARDGYFALVLPDLAQGSRAPRDVGFHVYRGDAGWEEHLGGEAARRLYVGWWA